jgi:hypothetical protein
MMKQNLVHQNTALESVKPSSAKSRASSLSPHRKVKFKDEDGGTLCEVKEIEKFKEIHLPRD